MAQAALDSLQNGTKTAVKSFQKVHSAELLGDRRLTREKGKGIWGWDQLTLETLGTGCHLWESCSPVPEFEVAYRANTEGSKEEHPWMPG